MDSTDNELYEIYVLSFNNKEREERMRRRFSELNMDVNFYCLKENDPRVDYLIKNGVTKDEFKILGNFYNMIKIMEDFYNNSTKELIVIFEDDVFLKKTLKEDLLHVSKVMLELNLDVLLIGYLLDNVPSHYKFNFIRNDAYDNQYYNYPDDLWGTQGFILTRKQAKFIIDRYTVERRLDKNRTEEFAADWIFTKLGKRAFVYPPLVVEEGQINSNHWGQIQYHKRCREFLYNNNYTS